MGRLASAYHHAKDAVPGQTVATLSAIDREELATKIYQAAEGDTEKGTL